MFRKKKKAEAQTTEMPEKERLKTFVEQDKGQQLCAFINPSFGPADVRALTISRHKGLICVRRYYLSFYKEDRFKDETKASSLVTKITSTWPSVVHLKLDLLLIENLWEYDTDIELFLNIRHLHTIYAYEHKTEIHLDGIDFTIPTSKEVLSEMDISLNDWRWK